MDWLGKYDINKGSNVKIFFWEWCCYEYFVLVLVFVLGYCRKFYLKVEKIEIMFRIERLIYIIIF